MQQQEPARILTINQVAEILQCSKAHVSNVLNGKVAECAGIAALLDRPEKTDPPGMARCVAGGVQVRC